MQASPHFQAAWLHNTVEDPGGPGSSLGCSSAATQALELEWHPSVFCLLLPLRNEPQIQLGEADPTRADTLC